MMKKVLLSACFLLIVSMLHAQNFLEITNVSQPNDVYSSPNDKAALLIRCHQSIPLRFVSSMDKSAEPNYKVLIPYITLPSLLEAVIVEDSLPYIQLVITLFTSNLTYSRSNFFLSK